MAELRDRWESIYKRPYPEYRAVVGTGQRPALDRLIQYAKADTTLLEKLWDARYAPWWEEAKPLPNGDYYTDDE